MKRLLHIFALAAALATSVYSTTVLPDPGDPVPEPPPNCDTCIPPAR